MHESPHRRFSDVKSLSLEIALSKPAVALLETAPSAGLRSARSVCDAFTCWTHKPVDVSSRCDI